MWVAQALVVCVPGADCEPEHVWQVGGGGGGGLVHDQLAWKPASVTELSVVSLTCICDPVVVTAPGVEVPLNRPSDEAEVEEPSSASVANDVRWR